LYARHNDQAWFNDDMIASSLIKVVRYSAIRIETAAYKIGSGSKERDLSSSICVTSRTAYKRTDDILYHGYPELCELPDQFGMRGQPR
jgi:hypothetical protein